MGERELIERTERPATVSSIVRDLRALGVETGSVLMVHSLVTREDDLAELGAAFAETGKERSGPVAAAAGRLMRSRDLIDFATEWMREHR